MKEDYAESYGQLEDRHWWFRGRRTILRDLLGRLTWSEAPAVLEIGAGSGANLASVFPAGARLRGVEPFEHNASVARKRTGLRIDVATAEQLPADIAAGSLDAIAMFDVLEHTEDDRLVLREVAGRLKPGGRLLLTVPAYMWLWGRQDVVSHHYRRYTRPELAARLRECGFTVRRATYFNSLFFPLIALMRVLARWKGRGTYEEGSDFDHQSGPLSPLLEWLFAAERYWLRVGNFPCGVSLFMVAERSTTDTDT